MREDSTVEVKPILFAATTDSERSLSFYRDTLGLQFISDEPFALVFNTAGTMLRVQKVEQVVPPPYTSLGWEVKDIEQAATELINKGLTFEQFPFLTQDDRGIWTTPDEAQVAWFKDPDGNLISITQSSS
jgi:catechol 2,3-dioxygenase-like lactoylglutathione lyase family enzyme